MATFYQTETAENYQTHQKGHLIDTKCQEAIYSFRKILNSYALFHTCFILLLLAEITLTITLVFIASKTPFFAISLASVFLTFFSYLIINYYFQGKKTDQFHEIKNRFFQECHKLIVGELPTEEIHFTLANSAFQMASYLGQKEVYASTIPPLKFFEQVVHKIGFLLHATDVLLMQELLMHSSIKEHMALVTLNPTDLCVHTSLANAYTALAKIYQKPMSCPFSDPWIIDRIYKKEAISEKFSFATERAIEELKILDDLAPNDPWVHAQLANCYHHLEMYDREILEYEMLLNLRPKDKELLYRLGLLYFRLGKNAKGLQIYQSLKKIDAKDAAHLIGHYNSMHI